MSFNLAVGVGVTEVVGSDRYPYTILRVISPRKIVVGADHYRRTDKNGLSEAQTYEYEIDLDQEGVVVTLRKNGHWYKQGEPMGSSPFVIGIREAYQDPSF